jgi:hypothetical protein
MVLRAAAAFEAASPRKHKWPEMRSNFATIPVSLSSYSMTDVNATFPEPAR